MDWLYFTNPTTGGVTEVPDMDGVREQHEAKGWVLSERPEPAPFVPAPGNDAPADSPWVKLYHPAVDAFHDYPNNPEAIAGAMESGWVYPPVAEPPAETADPEPEPVKKSKTKPATSAVAESEE